MLNGVKAKAFQAELLRDPSAPILDVCDDFVVMVVDIAGESLELYST